jgi:hypothetical protein
VRVTSVSAQRPPPAHQCGSWSFGGRSLRRDTCGTFSTAMAAGKWAGKPHHGRGPGRTNSAPNSLRTGKLTGNLQNSGLPRRFWQPVGEKIQSLAAGFPELSKQGNFFVQTGNSSPGTGNLRDRSALYRAALASHVVADRGPAAAANWCEMGFPKFESYQSCLQVSRGLARCLSYAAIAPALGIHGTTTGRRRSRMPARAIIRRQKARCDRNY